MDILILLDIVRLCSLYRWRIGPLHDSNDDNETRTTQETPKIIRYVAKMKMWILWTECKKKNREPRQK